MSQTLAGRDQNEPANLAVVVGTAEMSKLRCTPSRRQRRAAATSRKRGITSRVSIGAGSACIQESSCSLSKGPKRVPHSWGMHSMHKRVRVGLATEQMRLRI